MAAGTTNTSRPVARGSRGARLAVWFASLGAIAAVGMFGALLVFVFGQVHGVEICPETLERRSFAFLEIPLIGYQVRGSLYNDVSGDLEKHLSSANLVPQPPTAKKTWHVIYVVRGFSGIRRGDPEILVRYLEAKNGNHELAWLQWTKDHPELAPAVWKGVTDLAIAGKYTVVPDLLEIAEAAADKDQAQAQVTRLVNNATKK